MVMIFAKKYPSGQTRNCTQAVGDPKVSFHLTTPHDLDLAHGFEYELFIILVLARKPFLNEVILMPQHQYVRRLLDSARTNF
jgi:hypothetical protein